jgi:hypothetical protein
MKTRYKILIGVVIAGIFFYSIYLALFSKNHASAPPATSSAVPTLSVPAQGGGEVQVNDFTKSPQQTLGDTLVIEQDNDYSIVYFTKDQSFLISILSTPVQEVRIMAEQELLSKLKIQEADACKLNVVLTVPAGVDENLAGRNYGLSFCPSGQAFPPGS